MRLNYLIDEMCQMNTRVGRIARMTGFAHSPSPSPKASADKDDASCSSDDNLSVTCSLSFLTKRGSSFGFESSLVLRGRVSIGHF